MKCQCGRHELPPVVNPRATESTGTTTWVAFPNEVHTERACGRYLELSVRLDGPDKGLSIAWDPEDRRIVCHFDVAWVGRCKRRVPCPDHADKKCSVCGAQAVRDCDHTGQFVCGSLLCGDCEGFETNDDPGAWGFANHRHRRKADRPKERHGA